MLKLIQTFIEKARTRILPYDQLSQLVFGRQNCGNHLFFAERYGQSHTITLPQWPQYQLLQGDMDRPYGGTCYDDYLKASWSYLSPENNTPEKRAKKIQDLVELYRQSISLPQSKRAPFDSPILLCPRPDGKNIIIDGYHRAAIALKAQWDTPFLAVSPKKYLGEITKVEGETFGSSRLGLPYQSIFNGEKELLRGLRPDILTRIRTLDPNDLEGKTILDLGCNTGSNCFCAIQHGARQATGVDYSAKLISVAHGLNAYFALPCTFMVHDLNIELTQIEPFDTVFCFSITSHLKNKDALRQTIITKTKRVLYFEGHAHDSLSNYEDILNKDYFKTIDLIGYMRNRIQNRRKNRPLFRCERHS